MPVKKKKAFNHGIEWTYPANFLDDPKCVLEKLARIERERLRVLFEDRWTQVWHRLVLTWASDFTVLIVANPFYKAMDDLKKAHKLCEAQKWEIGEYGWFEDHLHAVSFIEANAADVAHVLRNWMMQPHLLFDDLASKVMPLGDTPWQQ